jgi:hypothetical protein
MVGKVVHHLLVLFRQQVVVEDLVEMLVLLDTEILEDLVVEHLPKLMELVHLIREGQQQTIRD